MSDLASVRAIVHGRVQGVFFRDFVSRQAKKLDLAGYVRNLYDGTVEVLAEGERRQLDELIGYLNIGPSAARVEKVVTGWSEYTGNYPGFRVKY